MARQRRMQPWQQQQAAVAPRLITTPLVAVARLVRRVLVVLELCQLASWLALRVVVVTLALRVVRVQWVRVAVVVVQTRLRHPARVVQAVRVMHGSQLTSKDGHEIRHH